MKKRQSKMCKLIDYLRSTVGRTDGATVKETRRTKCGVSRQRDANGLRNLLSEMPLKQGNGDCELIEVLHKVIE